MTASPQDIIELCASVAASHGEVGAAIANAIRAIDLELVIPIAGLPNEEARRKYIHRKTVKGRRYIYFRTPAGKLTRLPADEASKEFWKQYLRCWREMKFGK